MESVISTVKILKGKKKKIIGILIPIFLTIVLAIEMFSVYVVYKFSHPNRLKDTIKLESYGIKDYEKLSFNSSDKKVKLEGYLMKKENSNKTIIICHGYKENKFEDKSNGKMVVDQVKLAKFFIDEGYNALIFDFRGHGDFKGTKGTTIGYNEQKDLLGAIELIKSKGLGEKIGLIGFSMGAGTSLSVLDKTKDVGFVIADSPYSDLKEYLEENIKNWTGLPDFPFKLTILANFKLFYNVDFSKVSPINSLENSNVPVLLVHGKKDKTIPYTESLKLEKIFKNKNSDIELFDESDHIGSYNMYENKYKKVLKEFLNKA